ncbi:hypothetical protein [Novispirillum itersonii]|uniref:hypothetical protein n=1 Tax=Novispirillum itersonii TaxID=189 RepID=UPI0009DC08A9|nr:hypothetical protein [Novispirillum itersonii]
MRLFYSDIGSTEFFSYVGNLVSLEKAISVIAMLSPDFILRDNCIFWRDNADEYEEIKYPMIGLKLNKDKDKDKDKKHEITEEKKYIEMYRNNFSISQFFSSWEELPDIKCNYFDINGEDRELCFIFAEQIKYHWTIALKEAFPNRSFEFEIGDNILDEYGVCLTFWQTEESRAIGALEGDSIK